MLIALSIIPFLPYLKELVTADEDTTLDWGGTVLSVLSMLSLVMGFLMAVRLGALANCRYLTGVVTYTSRSVFLAGFLFVAPLFMQSALGFSAFESGLGVLPFSVATFALSMGTANLGEKIKPKYLIQAGLGIIIVAVGIFIAAINLEMTIRIRPS